MTMPTPVVAIINTSEEVIAMLALAFEDEGFTVVGEHARTLAFRREEQSLQQFLELHQPRVVVWDIAPPYEENWAYFQQVQASGAFRGRGVVLTTTNKRVLDQLVGETRAIELVGKPFDLGEIVAAVRRELQRLGANDG